MSIDDFTDPASPHWWRSVSPRAVQVRIEIKSQIQASGSSAASVRIDDLAEALGTGRRTIEYARDELVKARLLVEQPGRPFQPTVFALGAGRTSRKAAQTDAENTDSEQPAPSGQESESDTGNVREYMLCKTHGA